MIVQSTSTSSPSQRKRSVCGPPTISGFSCSTVVPSVPMLTRRTSFSCTLAWMGVVRSRRSAFRRSCSNMCEQVVAQSQAVAFEAFQERDYRRFWTTQFISNIGSWMQGIAQGWLVYRMTDSPFLLGFVGFANSIPQFFLMLPGGVVADRLDRKRVVGASQWVQTLTALSLAIEIYFHHIAVWQIITAAIITGIAMSFSG